MLNVYLFTKLDPLVEGAGVIVVYSGCCFVYVTVASCLPVCTVPDETKLLASCTFIVSLN